MSDLSLPHCEKCGRVEYDCVCVHVKCFECGETLTEGERGAGRGICFGCYRAMNDPPTMDGEEIKTKIAKRMIQKAIDDGWLVRQPDGSLIEKDRLQ